MKTPPEDRSTLERDYAETRRMKQVIAAIIVLALVAWFILQHYQMG